MLGGNPESPGTPTAAVATEGASSPLAGLEAVLETVLDAAVVVDDEGIILFANRSVERVFGHLPVNLVGRPIEVLVPVEHRTAHEQNRRAYLRAPRPRPMAERSPLQGLRQDGSRFPAEISLAPLTLPSGTYVTAVVRDVTVAQARLRSERHLMVSQRVARLGSWERDDVTGQTQWSAECYRMLGLEPGAGQPSLEAVLQRVHPDDRPALDAEFSRALSERGPWVAVVRGIDPPRTFAVRGSVDLDEEGNPVRNIGTVQDITDMTALQRELGATTGRFRATFDQAPIGMALLDVRPGHPWRQLMVNPALVDALGLSERELLDKPLLERVHPGDRPGYRRLVSDLACGVREAVHAEELRIIRSDGQQRWMALSGSLVRDGEGIPEYVVAHLQDISDRKYAEQAAQSVAARDARIAAVLQDNLLPFVARRVGPLWVASRYLPAGNGELVGGDWTDVFALPNGRIGIVVGDVAGHGIQAAATMSRLRTVLRMLATSGLSPAGVLRRINEAMFDTDLQADIDLATIVHAQLEPATGILVHSSAGHLPMVVLPRPNGSVPAIAVPVPSLGGPPIGVVAHVSYAEDAIALAPGSRLIGFTDGLIERSGQDLDDALLDLFRRLSELSDEVTSDVEMLADGILSLSANGAARDDIAVIVLDFQPNEPDPTARGESARPRSAQGIRVGGSQRWVNLEDSYRFDDSYLLDELFDESGLGAHPSETATWPLLLSQAETVLLDRSGVIVATNDAWRMFCVENGGDPARTGAGVSYLDVCDRAGDPLSLRVAAAIRAAVNGDLPEPVTLEIPCDGPSERRRFSVLISCRQDRLGRPVGATISVSALARLTV